MVDYGTTVSCVSDLAAPARLVSGLRVVGEAIARRLLTPAGGLIDDPEYGLDLRQYVNGDLTRADLARLASEVETEARKDERVAAAKAVVAYDERAFKLTVTIEVRTGAGPFSLVLTVSQASATYLLGGFR